MSVRPPLVSIIIPARNEESDLPGCLASVLAQDFPHDCMEVLVISGSSEDQTVGVAERALAAGDVAFRVIDNQGGTTPGNLNVGLASATGHYVCRVDARSIVPADYVRRCVAVLEDRAVAVVGGRQVAVPRVGAGLRARTIARALNNRWAMGLSRYRRSTTSGRTDTVYLGAFRREDLLAVGGWSTDLPTNQDFDLNQRLQERGAIWFDPSLEVGYLPREQYLDVARQYFRFGRWKVRYWRLRGVRPAPRQLLLLSAPPLLALLAVSGIRRRPLMTLTSAAAGLVALERTGSSASAPLLERAGSVLVIGIVGCSWWSGVAWQLCRD